MKEYHFFMQRATKDGVGTGRVYDLESAFPGLRYSSCKGLETVGAPKNIYTEDYAEFSGLRTYHPADSGGEIAHEATKIELTLLFLDNGRREAYNSFCSFLDGGRLFYWDNARNKKVWLILDSEQEPDEDTLKPAGYILVKFVFTNLWGIGKKCNDSGVLL